MSITFLNLSKKFRIREPFLKKIRATYRGPRNSYEENLEVGLILNDLNKLDNELEFLNDSAKQKIETFGTIYRARTLEAPDVEAYYEDYEDISLFYGENSEEYNPLVLDSLAKVGSSISRISQKVKRLETGN